MYSTYPQEMKSLGDWAFAQGVNSTALQLYIQQPYENVYPGIDAWFGREFNRQDAWYRHVDLITIKVARMDCLKSDPRFTRLPERRAVGCD